MEKINGVLSGTNIKTLYDYIDADGKLKLNNEARTVMVTSEADLSELDGYLPGSIAFTAGYASMWQLNAANTWVELQ